MPEYNQELWLIRHGETEWSTARRHTGRTDIPLTDMGRRQAEALAGQLAGQSFALVLTSPLSRARETCRLAGHGADAEITDALCEWDYGIYEGRTTGEIRKETPGWSIWTADPPCGETISNVAARAAKVIDEATAVNGKVALFSHAHMLRVIAACWLGLPPAAGRFFTMGTASLSILGYERETRAILTWNRDCHLTREEKTE